MMQFNELIRLADHPRKADQWAVCAINRHLRMFGFIC